MSDAIFTLLDGTDIAAYDTPAWHNKGTVKGRLMTSQEALIDAAFHRVEVVEEPLFTKSGPVETHKVVRLKDDQGNLYKPFVVGANRPTFDFAMLLENAERAAHATGASISSLFRLRDGALVGATLKMPEDIVIGRDKYSQFFNLVDSIDASSPARFFDSDVRQVCWNTVRYAESRRDKSRTFSAKHTRFADQRITPEAIRRVVEISVKHTEDLSGMLTSLYDEDFTKSEFFRLVDAEFGVPDPSAKTSRSQTIYDNRMSTLSALWTAPTQESTYKFGRSTKLTAFQTLVEYIDHNRPVKGSDPKAVRFASNLDGTADVMKGKILTALGVSL